MTGASYGGAFDLTPTSEGQVECRLQYPADAAARTVLPATTALQAAFEQYVYPPLWEPEGGQIPLAQTISYGNWDLFDANRHAAAPLSGDDWYGLQGGFAVQAAGPWRPQATYHYVPVLWLAAAAPYAQAPAQPGPPATGLRTVGLQGHAARPAEPAPGLGDAQGQAGAAGRRSRARWPCRSAPRPARRAVGRPGHAGHRPAQGGRRVDAGPQRQDRRERRLAAQGARRAHHAAGAPSPRPRPASPVEYSLVKRTVVRR